MKLAIIIAYVRRKSGHMIDIKNFRALIKVTF